jgi:hypothetical protein
MASSPRTHRQCTSVYLSGHWFDRIIQYGHSAISDRVALMEAYHAWNFACVFTALAIPLALGAMMLRYERAAHESISST